MTWPGLFVYAAHLVALPAALIRPRLVILAIVATAAFRAEKLGPNIISTNQLEGLALAAAIYALWRTAGPLRLRRLDYAVFGLYGLILLVRVLQAISFDVGAYRLAQFAYQDAFRPMVYFLAAHVYLRAGGRPDRLAYAACVSVAVMIVAVLLEWQFFWSWRAFFGAEFARAGINDWEFVSRFGYRLINGPFGHWVGTGTFLVLYLPFALAAMTSEPRRLTLWRAALAAAGLAAVMIIGGRAAMLGGVLAGATALALFVLTPSRPLASSPSWTPFAFGGLGLIASGRVRAYAKQGYDYLYLSLFPGAGEAQNLTARTDLGAILWANIGNVPLIGYGWRVVREPDMLRMPISHLDFEVNFVALYAYDVGLALSLVWVAVLVAAAATAAWHWVSWPASDRWTAAVVLMSSAALLPILASNGGFTAQFAQPWLLAVALMTHTAGRRAAQRRSARRPLRPGPRARPPQGAPAPTRT